MNMFRPPSIVDNELLIAIYRRILVLLSTDISFTGKAPRSPRLEMTRITFWKCMSPSTGKDKYIWRKILAQV